MQPTHKTTRLTCGVMLLKADKKSDGIKIESENPVANTI